MSVTRIICFKKAPYHDDDDEYHDDDDHYDDDDVDYQDDAIEQVLKNLKWKKS